MPKSIRPHPVPRQLLWVPFFVPVQRTDFSAGLSTQPIYLAPVPNSMLPRLCIDCLHNNFALQSIALLKVSLPEINLSYLLPCSTVNVRRDCDRKRLKRDCRQKSARGTG